MISFREYLTETDITESIEVTAKTDFKNLFLSLAEKIFNTATISQKTQGDEFDHYIVTVSTGSGDAKVKISMRFSEDEYNVSRIELPVITAIRTSELKKHTKNIKQFLAKIEKLETSLQSIKAKAE